MTWPSRDVIREALRILVTQAPGPIADAPSPIRLATIVIAADTPISVVILRKAYARLGYAVEISRYPAEVALRLADAGREDGEVQRINGLSKHYPNLVQLHPAINYIEAAVFSAGRDIPLDGWSSLQPYRVGVMRGIKFAEFNTRGMNRTLVGDYTALFQMLGEGRYDVAVSPRMMGILELKRLGTTGISPVEPPLERFPVFHYIHRSRAELAPKLEVVFQSMQETGELTAIRQQVIAELMRWAEKGQPLCEG